MSEKWIQKSGINKPGYKGALHRALGVPEGEPIPAGKLQEAAHARGRLGRMARMAVNLKKMH